LGDDFCRGFGIKEAMPNDLADDLIGSTVVSLGAAFLRHQAVGAELLELLTELKIAAATESELLGCGLGSEVTLAFEQQGQTARELIILRDGQRARITDESVIFEIEDRHDRSSVEGYKKASVTGGRRISSTAQVRLCKYGGRKINMGILDNTGKALCVFWHILPPYLIML
jgi:hypothetical protein